MVMRFGYLLLLLILSQQGVAQPFRIDSLKGELSTANNDTSMLILNGQIANAYVENSPDSMYRYAGKMVVIARNLGLKLEEAHALGEVGFAQLNMGDYPHSLQTLLLAADLAIDPAIEKEIINSSGNEYFIDVFDIMMTKKGTPGKKYFDADGLHLSNKGYELFEEAVLKVMF
jgi:hypothetical protein